MLVAIVGSRSIGPAVREEIMRYVMNLPTTDNVITGDANGADEAARDAAKGKRVLIVVEPAWDSNGSAAGPLRNNVIASYCDRMVAFWDGKSKGTKSAIAAAKSLGKTIEVVTV